MSDILTDLLQLERATRESGMVMISNCVNEAINEIERLKAQVEEPEPTNTSAFCVKHNQMFLPDNKSSKWHTCPFCTIEMLKKEIERLRKERECALDAGEKWMAQVTANE
jgi:uncharacterized small protein (DUF1192 family)